MHMPGEFYDYSWVFHFWYCSRKGARLAEERKKERKKEQHITDDETGFSTASRFNHRNATRF